MIKEGSGYLKTRCRNWKSYVRKISFFRLKSTEWNWRLRSKKFDEIERGAVLSRIQNETVYLATLEIYDERKCSISECYRFAGIPRSAYYRWLKQKAGENEKFDQKLFGLIKEAY